MENRVKGILVGCDDEDVGGYEWVINHHDFDNSNPEIINKLDKYKNKRDFRIYFYVFKTPTQEPAKTSDEYRGTIFGRAEIKKIERNKNNPEKYKYVHHVKIKNFEPFEPKIKLEDIEDKLEKYGWTEDQKSNFGVNLSHHGLLLTEKDCNLINKSILVANKIKKINLTDNVEDMKMMKEDSEMEDDHGNINDYTGFIIGLYHRPERMGYEHVLDSCGDDGHDPKFLTRVSKMKGKQAYFYIFESRDKKYWKLNEWERFLKESDGKILGKIFGEGLIKDVVNNEIIYQYVTHYREYVDIDDVKNLSKRIDEINRKNRVKKSVKQRITIGLSITREECDKISELAGVA